MLKEEILNYHIYEHVLLSNVILDIVRNLIRQLYAKQKSVTFIFDDYEIIVIYLYYSIIIH